MATDATLIEKLDDLLAAIGKYDDPRRASTEWRQAFNHLKKTDLPSKTVANTIAMRSIERLAELVDQLKQAQAAEAAPPPATADPADRPDDITCRKALRAFKKRLRLVRLDDESQIDARNPLSKGGQSEVSSIMPPDDWGQDVWQELARRGKLRHTGRGFYELTGH